MTVPTLDFGNLPMKDLAISSLNDEEENVFCNFKDIFSKNVGFVIKNHGIPNQLFKDMLKQSKMFFELPVSVKRNYTKSNDKTNSYTGYYVSGKQKFRERYDITFDTNKYPVEVENFEKTFMSYREHSNRLVKYLLILIAKYFNLSHEFFVRQHSALFDGSSDTKSHLATIYYKTTSNECLMDKHTDISTFTLLFASSPGLQICCNDEWVDVDCGHKNLVFHVGDLLQRWTGGLCSPTVHRVSNFNKSGDDRISIAYFVHPNCKTVVQPFNHCEFEAVIAEDYWKSKFYN